MKIDTDGLKAMFWNPARRKTPSSRAGCPPPEKMVKLLRSRSSGKEAAELIDHVSRCGSCFSEFGFLLDVFRQEKEFIREVEIRTAGRLERRTLISRFSWRPALILAGFLIAGFFMARFIIHRPAETYRTGSPAAVELVKPARENVARAALSFEWRKVDGADYYILDLYDQALAPVWKSDKIFEETAALPEELAASLEVNRSFFWTATAFLRNGDKVASRLERFVLTE
ncbi:MAG: hypothetical protein WBC70_16590 [Candidatus Aminicenantales bacterium]